MAHKEYFKHKSLNARERFPTMPSLAAGPRWRRVRAGKTKDAFDAFSGYQ